MSPQREPTILDRQTIAPIAVDTHTARDVAARYPARLGPLVGGVAGSSPYLAQVLARECEWIAHGADAPEAAFHKAITGARTAAEAPEGAAVALRMWKRRVAGLLALGDLSGAFTLQQVTTPLTDFADATVAGAFNAALQSVSRGDLDAASAGLSVLAMGKMGAHELNYSSDIDLIVLFDEARHRDAGQARHTLIRATRGALKILSEITEEGYVFRTDMRLRPDAAVTRLVVGANAARRYYEEQGRTWERLAFIKARPALALDPQVGEGALAALVPFVWRRRLDFAAIKDIYELRLKIRNHKRLHEQKLDGFNLKLGRGGIRDIELFVQSHQIIHGGRNRNLRPRGTCPALMALCDGGFIDGQTGTMLRDIYVRHRTLEHRLQMIRDTQTQTLPTTGDDWDRVTALMGEQTASVQRQIEEDISYTSGVCEAFFNELSSTNKRPSQPTPVEPETSATGGNDPRSNADIGADLFGADLFERWSKYPALRSPRAREIFERLRPMLLGRLSKAINPQQALAHFDQFLHGMPAGVQLFALFEARPQLSDLLVSICAKSPVLADYLGRNSGLLDAVLDTAFFDPVDPRRELEATLAERLSEQRDYEAILTETRAWTKEQHFRIGVQLLDARIGAPEAADAYATLANAVIGVLFGHVSKEFQAKHGPPPGSGAVVIAMGSFGAERLHAASDLDLLLVYDADGVEASTGSRPLETRRYYARLTQSLITALTAPLSTGRLYEVDMRLRPSGHSGPLAVSIQAFAEYQRDKAWTWEHLALTRSRVVTHIAAIQSDLAQRFDEVRAAELTRPRDSAQTIADVQDMRRRLFETRPGSDAFDIRNGPGGQQDVELFVQTLSLLSGSHARAIPDQVRDAAAAGNLDQRDAELLNEIYARYSAGRAMVMLVNPGAKTVQELGDEGVLLVANAMGCATPDPHTPDPCALESTLAEDRARAAQIIEDTLHQVGAKR